MKNKIIVLIPCFNCELTIKKSLNKLQHENLKRISKILVIDNNSNDKTLKELLKVKKFKKFKNKILIQKNQDNYGLGGSLKKGFIFSIQNNFKYILILHADNQCDNNLVLKNFLLNMSVKKDVDFFMASRFLKNSDLSGYNKLRILGNYFFNFLTFIFTFQKFTDSGCGIVAIKTEVLKQINFLELSNSFYFNPQLNVHLSALNNLKRIDIPLNWHDSEVPSNLKVFKYLVGLTVYLISYGLGKKKLKKLSNKEIVEFKKIYITKNV